MSETAYETDTQPLLDSGDHDRFAHFVEKKFSNRVNGKWNTSYISLRKSLGTIS